MKFVALLSIFLLLAFASAKTHMKEKRGGRFDLRLKPAPECQEDQADGLNLETLKVMVTKMCSEKVEEEEPVLEEGEEAVEGDLSGLIRRSLKVRRGSKSKYSKRSTDSSSRRSKGKGKSARRSKDVSEDKVADSDEENVSEEKETETSQKENASEDKETETAGKKKSSKRGKGRKGTKAVWKQVKSNQEALCADDSAVDSLFAELDTTQNGVVNNCDGALTSEDVTSMLEEMCTEKTEEEQVENGETDVETLGSKKDGRELPAFCDTPVETLVETYFGEQPLTQGDFAFGMMKLKAVSSLETFCAAEEVSEDEVTGETEDEVTEETEETESEKTLEAIARRLLKSKSDKKSRKSDKESNTGDKREELCAQDPLETVNGLIEEMENKRKDAEEEAETGDETNVETASKRRAMSESGSDSLDEDEDSAVSESGTDSMEKDDEASEEDKPKRKGGKRKKDKDSSSDEEEADMTEDIETQESEDGSSSANEQKGKRRKDKDSSSSEEEADDTEDLAETQESEDKSATTDEEKAAEDVSETEKSYRKRYKKYKSYKKSRERKSRTSRLL